MEAVAINTTPFLVRLADNALRDSRPVHDFAEGLGERANVLAFRQRWKDKRFLVIWRGEAQQIVLKRRVNRHGDCFARFTRLVRDGLDR